MSIFSEMLRVDRSLANRPAVVEPGGSLSYDDLWVRSRSRAGGLQAMGVLPGDRVLISLENSRELVVSFFAAQLAGATVVWANPTYGEAERKFLVRSTTPRAIITRDGLPETAEYSEVADDPERYAMIVFTSGSTGKPKGAPIRAAQLIRQARLYAWALRTTAGGRRAGSHSARSLLRLDRCPAPDHRVWRANGPAPVVRCGDRRGMDRT